MNETELKAKLGRESLRGADLRRGNLYEADLRGVDLRRANLRGANLNEADLHGALLSAYLIVPETGSFIAYKKVCGRLVTVKIPHDAKRTSSLVGRKCRAEFVDVLAIEDLAEGQSIRSDRNAIYQAGCRVRADQYDEDIRVDCTHGIHFFLTRAEALAWSY